MANSLYKNFICYHHSVDFDTRRYADLKTFRSHKAEVTAGKLIAYIEKEDENDED